MDVGLELALFAVALAASVPQSHPGALALGADDDAGDPFSAVIGDVGYLPCADVTLQRSRRSRMRRFRAHR
ncbi:hypothetical protein D3C83_86220 [compost metagenome]